jgi:oxygen-independent coproporphyrinogen-3 oxidase
LDLVREALPLDPEAEIAIECDPSLLTLDKVRELGEMGFNRISMGIQDFNRKVLDAVHRRIPKLAISGLVAQARTAGFRGINLDLIYGLPHQTLDSFRDTLRQTLEADPDRVSVFAYAHVPWIKGHQSTLDALPMPGGAERLTMAILARAFFTEAGYVPIGMDHFVKPDDELARALADGQLHRNFQGYCSKRQTGQVYAFGSSAISQMEWGYGQNLKDLAKYIATVDRGELPLERVYYMTAEDLLARETINSLMCYGRVNLEAAASRAGVSAAVAAKYFSVCAERTGPLLKEGWVVREGAAYSLTGDGWLFVRQLAAALDPRTPAAEKAAEASPRFSKAI